MPHIIIIEEPIDYRLIKHKDFFLPKKVVLMS